jgi:anti-sigma-K factor RskA
MTDPHLLTGAYALDALDDVERAGVERHLRDCPECAAEVAEFREVGSWLADGVAQPPPPELKGRVLAQVLQTRQESPQPAPPPRVRRAVPRRPLLVAAAAVLLAGAASLGGVAWQNYEAAESARLQASRITSVMTDPTRTESSAQVAGGGTATVVAAGGSAVFAAHDLRSPGEGKTYQLWVIGSPDDITSAGLLELRDGETQAWVAGVAPGESLAVSVEPAGGSDQPTTTPVTNVPIA